MARLTNTKLQSPPVREAPRRLWDSKRALFNVRVLPGETYTTGDETEVVVTILGSCVAACIRNPRNGFGGLNHFMLPESDTGDWNGVSSALRYGNYAMEALINAVLKSGCERADLEIKLFGGAVVGEGGTQVGPKNIAFVKRYLDAEGLAVLAADLGGPVGRRIHFHPATGLVRRLLLKPTSAAGVLAEERRYRSTIAAAPVEGDIELFD